MTLNLGHIDGLHTYQVDVPLRRIICLIYQWENIHTIDVTGHS